MSETKLNWCPYCCGDGRGWTMDEDGNFPSCSNCGGFGVLNAPGGGMMEADNLGAQHQENDDE